MHLLAAWAHPVSLLQPVFLLHPLSWVMGFAPGSAHVAAPAPVLERERVHEPELELEPVLALVPESAVAHAGALEWEDPARRG